MIDQGWLDERNNSITLVQTMNQYSVNFWITEYTDNNWAS